MKSHKYKVGETVMFSAPTVKLVQTKQDVSGRRELYEIVQLLPAIGSDLQYRIKGGTDGRERMVVEHELNLLTPRQ